MAFAHQVEKETSKGITWILAIAFEVGLFNVSATSANGEDQAMQRARSVILVAAVLAAVAVGACRREVPEPNGLGAKDIAAAQSVVQ